MMHYFHRATDGAVMHRRWIVGLLTIFTIDRQTQHIHARNNLSTNIINARRTMSPTKPNLQRVHSGGAMNPQDEGANPKKLPWLDDLRSKYSHQPVFLQAVEEMALAVEPLFEDPEDGAFYKKAFLYLTEPERIISFHVPWEDDEGNQHINRGWRVEFSSALGPYKGGLRFHPTVNDGLLKFLGFEQIFKNALTGLPLGGGKGGSDFDPKGKSDGEIRRFCESFMTNLCRYIDAATDVPAGDIGVGGREIGYMYGQYKRLSNKHGEGVLTGKSPYINGIQLRPEATGFGAVMIAQQAIEDKLNRSLEGARCAVSGSGNVAQHATQLLIRLGAKVVSISDSSGALAFPEGMTQDDWEQSIKAKQVKRARLSTLDATTTGTYYPGKSVWDITGDLGVDFAFPCATQNEIHKDHADLLMKTGCAGIFEGANLPVTAEGQDVFRANPKVLYIPGKAANAGGVGVSGLEMSQNASRTYWTREKVDRMLKDMMAGIYSQMKEGAGKDGTLEQGCNRAGFLRVAHALKDLGWVY